MRNNGKGGMQISGATPSIICPKCGKPAAVKKSPGMIDAYMHYTKTGALWHIQNRRTGEWETKKYEDMPN